MTSTRAKRRARKANYVGDVRPITPWLAIVAGFVLVGSGCSSRGMAGAVSALRLTSSGRWAYFILHTRCPGDSLAKPKLLDPKLVALRQQGCLNPRPQRVADQSFNSSDFFDPRDLVQVKYEMVRRVRIDGEPVSRSATSFGFSRPSFYLAQAALERGGLAALVPQKRGPRRSHKLSTEVVDFLRRELSEDPSLDSSGLARRVEERFGRKVHPRSVERALARQEKKER
jgi:transposase